MRESQLFFLKNISQTINLAGSCWVSSFPVLLLSALHSINPLVSWVVYTWKLKLTCKNTLINPAVCLKTPLTCRNTLTNAVVSWVVYTWNIQLTCKNAQIIPVVSWVVYTWNLQLTRKNALINAVVSWVVYTWNLQLTCKNAVIIPLVSWVGYTWNTVNLQKYSNQCCSTPSNVYLKNT